MFALIARILGPLAEKIAVRIAAKEIYQKYGAKILNKIIHEYGDDLLRMTKEEIINLAKGFVGIGDDTIKTTGFFTKSNAKKFAKNVNKGVDKIEEIGGRWAERRVMASRTKDLGIDLGNEPGFEALKAMQANADKPVNKVVDSILGPLVDPITRKQAFAGGFVKGVSGEGLSLTMSRLIEAAILGPQSVLNTPKYRIMIRAAMKEIEILKQTDMVAAQKLYKAVQQARMAAKAAGVGEEYLGTVGMVGNLSGRATVIIGADFVFADEKERERNVAKYKKTIYKFTKKQVKVYVDGYTRRDGTRVKGHYREISVAA